MAAEFFALGGDFEAGLAEPTIELVQHQRMGQRNHRHVRLLAKGQTKGHCSMGGEVTNERIGNGLGRIGILHVFLVRILVLNGFVIFGLDTVALVLRFYLRFVLGPYIAALDLRIAIGTERDEHAATRDDRRVVGRTLGADRVDLVAQRLRLRRYLAGHILIGVIAFD